MNRQPADSETDTAQEFLTSERCYIAEILNDPGVPEVSLARTRVEPGITTELHSLTVAEWYVIKDGRGRVEVGDGVPRDVSCGDVVAIPAGTPQRITNTGATDLIFYCVCWPRFAPDSYTALE